MELWMGLAVAIAAIAAILLVIVIVCFINNRKTQQVLRHRILEITDSMRFGGISPVSLEEIQHGTNYFHEDNRLGAGGFGSVYKAIMRDGNTRAVKRLAQGSSQGNKEFETEISFLGDIRHKNLVQVHGYCSKENERMILYEYMPNGSLEDVLHDDEKRASLDWAARCKIMLDIGHGLAYLHELSGKNIAHLDIKPSNILLDGDMNAKIADLGMARFLDNQQGQTLPVGTFGYWDPHYFANNRFSAKSDIYSFGVILLVLITGKRVMDQDPSVSEHIIKWAWLLKDRGDAYLRLRDFTLDSSCTDEKFRRMLKLAFLCVQKYPEYRPSASDLISMLRHEGEIPEPSSPMLG